MHRLLTPPVLSFFEATGYALARGPRGAANSHGATEPLLWKTQPTTDKATGPRGALGAFIIFIFIKQPVSS